MAYLISGVATCGAPSPAPTPSSQLCSFFPTVSRSLACAPQFPPPLRPPIDTRSPFFGQITGAFSPPLPIESGPGAVAVMSGGTKFSLFRGVDEQGAGGFSTPMLLSFLEKAELAHHLGVETGTQW